MAEIETHEMSGHPEEAYILQLTSCQRRLYAYIFSLLGNRDHTEDVLQETNMVLWRRASEFQPGTNFTAFAFRVAHFQVLSFRQRAYRDHEKLLFDDELLEQLAERMQGDIEDEMRQRMLENCMKKLPPQHRELLRMRYADGSSVETIATTLQKSAGSVAMVLHRIRLALIRCVEQALIKGEP